MVICTHNLVEAEELADRIAIIRDGRIIAQGSGEELKTRFLGPPEYEVRILEPLNGAQLQLPPGVKLTAQNGDALRFSAHRGEADNADTLRALLGQGVQVASLREVPRSLEQVYLQAVKQ